MEIEIYGTGIITLKHLILDYNGTLAVDGVLKKGVAKAIEGLSKDFIIHVVTGDTFSSAKEQLKDLDVKIVIAPLIDQASFKLDYAKSVGLSTIVAIGNGKNDSLLLKYSRIGICVMQEEGACVETIQNSDIVIKDILSAFELLTHPKRLIATLRS